MSIDIRVEAAKYYDSDPDAPNDVPFYQGLIPSPDTSVLELGCGTGRVMLLLLPYCGYYQGLDISTAMLDICRQKLAREEVTPQKARVLECDITSFDLGTRFDLIIAPFRVLQNLETDTQVDGLFRCIHSHLAPGGTCILNVFMPNRDPEGLKRRWASAEEQLDWQAPVEGGRLACFIRRARMDAERLILYPELIYRRYEGDTLKDEAVLQIAMRCYYPDTFEQLILAHGFRIMNRWGGYAGEAYGKGSELVIQFAY